MHRSARLFACLLTLGALVVAGCGGSDSSSSSAAKTTPEKTATAAAAGGGVAIEAIDITFKPQTATAKVGEQVTWTNKDQIAHTVTSKGGPEKFDSGTLSGGDTFSFTPKKAGTYQYVCLIHPSQTGTLTVTK
jgi:plastocyanin